MIAHGIVIAFLLLFPWALLAVCVIGAIASAAKHSLGDLRRARNAKVVLCLPHGLRGQRIMRIHTQPSHREVAMRRAA